MRGFRAETFLSFLVLVDGSASFADDKSPRDLATELVQVMGVDARAARMLHQFADGQFNNGTLKLDQRECIRLVGREEFTDRLAKFVNRRLKPEEMRDAIEYFNSAIGKKHLEAVERKANVTAEDWPERRAFLDTPVGYQLFTRGLLTDSTELQRIVDLVIRDRSYECEKAH